MEEDNVNIQSFADALLFQGKSSEQKPLPEEYALGNLVKLNQSYRKYDYGIIRPIWVRIKLDVGLCPTKWNRR